jgi:L-ascorbate metabolism protein UlaG (beta-lactamase superfamily)
MTCRQGAIQPRIDGSGRRFSNPGGIVPQSLSAVLRLVLSKRTPWPSRVPVEVRRPPSPQHPGEAIVTFVGHSTFLIQTSLGNVLTDPIYSDRAGPGKFLGPRRVRQPGVAFGDLPDVSIVLVSHNHYDHLDLATLRALDRRFHPLFVTPLRNGPLLKSAGILRVRELGWWEDAAAIAPGISLTPAQHFSSRTPFDRNRALWGGFVVSTPSLRIFFAGDTGYGPHFRQIRERYGPVDLALLPIGAYEPRWFMKAIHMNPAEAVCAHADLEARRSIGMHFGTFRLAHEGIADPVAALEKELEGRQVPCDSFRTLEFGESFRLGG